MTLIDILAILLIFFIVTTTFKQKESLVKVNLPTSSEMNAEVTDEVRTVLSLSKDGGIALGDQVVSQEDLSKTLLEFKQANPEAKLELKADEGAPLGSMVGVWDAATKAGLEIGDLPLRILLKQ